MLPVGTKFYTSAAGTQTVQLPARTEPNELPPAHYSGAGGQNNNQGGGGNGGLNDRDGKGKDDDPPPKKGGRPPHWNPGGGGGNGDSSGVDEGSEAGSKREREKRERIARAESSEQRRGHLSYADVCKTLPMFGSSTVK